MALTYVFAALAVGASYVVCVVGYRLFLSPLARFPGPKLAAASFLYEAYFDLVQDGRFTWQIRELHREYGPVVRINPREIHVHDPDYVDYLYSQRLDKDPCISGSFGVPLSAFGTSGHELHRLRRGAANPFFSKVSIASRGAVILENVLKLCDRLQSHAENEEVVQMDAGFLCLTLDVIAEFCHGVNYKFLDVPGFDREFGAMMETVVAYGATFRLFPFIRRIMQVLPANVATRLAPQLADIIRIREMIRTQAKRVLAVERLDAAPITANESASIESYYDTKSAGVSHKGTVFHQIVGSRLSAEEKSEERLVQEGQTLIIAGSETTARVLYLSMVHLLKQPLLLDRLVDELRTVMPEPTTIPSLTSLEQLPFLTATIKESIRLSGSVSTRMSRISSASHPLQYKDWVFPPGTPVSLTLFDILMDPTVFPDPESFDPMRWLESEQTVDGHAVLKPKQGVDKFFVPFSRGPRACMGMWLAWAELYLTMAHVHRRFEIELYNTDIEDVAAACDRFTCYARPGNRGVRVKILGSRK